MPLRPATRLGPYEVISAIGAGGMGEVYRAKDTRLDRIVAIKVLPEHLSSNPQLRERFEREARAVSSLSHPNICPLYDVGQQDGIDYLVMEYLEGETLAHRLKKGPLLPDQALQCAIQIADALDTAHRHRVIHRDLKPGNIMLTKSGTKLLDFGLAKVRAAEVAAGMTTLPTETTPLTGEGTILGTLQYMAPEQLEGVEADARTDIFAFGATIYEMATGRKAFEGKSRASLIAAILEREPPPISTLQTMAPPALDHVVRTCLAKEPDARWQTAHDVLIELKWIAEAGSQALTRGPIVARRNRREVLAWALVAALFLALGASVAVFRARVKPPELHPARFIVPPPERVTLEWSDLPVVSPDGQRFVFSGTSADGTRQLWIRSLDSPELLPLAGTEESSLPFWSPDSRFIAFFSQGKLKKIGVSGGPVQVLCDASNSPSGGTWSRDGVILFGARPSLFERVSADGGEVQVVRKLNELRHETGQGWPHFLPDGRHFLYAASSADAGKGGIFLGSLDCRETRFLISPESNVSYVPPGFLVYSRQETLLAQPFDIRGLRVAADAFPIAEQVGQMRVIPGSLFSVSENGVLVYRRAGSNTVQLAWYNRAGKRLGSIGEPGAYAGISLSPDERRLAVERLGSQLQSSDVWILELTSGILSRLTFGSSDSAPVWSPDARQLAFTSCRMGVCNLYSKVVGGGEEEHLFASEYHKFSKDWLKDGKSILFIDINGRTFYQLPLAGERKPVTLTKSEFNRDNPDVSPDGHWVAYNSFESGRWEVYVAAFPTFTEKRQVSLSGGCQPLWKKDGKELFYLGLEGKLMVVEVKGAAKFETAVPQVLFQTPVKVNPTQIEYSVTGDGERFILREPVGESTTPITVVLNWNAEPKR